MHSMNANDSRVDSLMPIRHLVAGLVACAFLGVGGDLAQAQNDSTIPLYQPFRISRETTRITGPITSEGLVDYAVALDAQYSQGVTLENNALIPLLRIMPDASVLEGIEREYLGRLKLREFPLREKVFVNSPIHWTEREAIERFRDELIRSQARFWTAQELPQIADWLNLNSAALEIIVEASRRPRYFEPSIPVFVGQSGPVDVNPGLISAPQVGLNIIVQSGGALRARSLQSASAGNLEAASTDLLAAFRLAHLLGQRPDMIGLYRSHREETNCHWTLREIVLNAPVTNKWLTDIQNELDLVPELISLAERVDVAGRYQFLDATQRVYRGGGLLLRAVNDLSDAGGIRRFRGGRTAYVAAYQIHGKPIDLWRMRLSPETVTLRLTDWNKVLQQGNDWHDRVAAANRIAAPREHLAATDQLTHEWGRCRLEPTIAREEYVNHPLVRIHSVLGALPFGGGLTDVVTALPIHLPLARKYCTQGTYGVCVGLAGVRPDWGPSTIYRFQTQQRLTVVTLGLKKYHNRFQRYPAMLSDLVPDFLARVPTEVYDEARDFMYESDSRHFTLTSVGANGVLDEPRLPILEKDDIVLSSLRRDGN